MDRLTERRMREALQRLAACHQALASRSGVQVGDVFTFPDVAPCLPLQWVVIALQPHEAPASAWVLAVDEHPLWGMVDLRVEATAYSEACVIRGVARVNVPIGFFAEGCRTGLLDARVCEEAVAKSEALPKEGAWVELEDDALDHGYTGLPAYELWLDEVEEATRGLQWAIEAWTRHAAPPGC